MQGNTPILNSKWSASFFAVIVAYYFFRVSDWFFFFDDIVFLHHVIHTPFFELLLPEHYFYHYRPLSQYGYFKLCYLLFGLNPLGYYLFNLSLLLLNLWVIDKIFTALGIDKIYITLVCLMMAASLSFYRNLIWLSNSQHIIPFLFIALTIYFEVLWNHKRKWIYKILGVMSFVLGLFSNFTTLLAIPLIGIVHLFFLCLEENRFSVGYYVRLLFTLSPYLILFAAFYWFYSDTTAYKNYQVLLNDKNSIYYAEFSVDQAFTTLEAYGKDILPSNEVILIIIPLIMIFSIVVFVKDFLAKKKQNNQLKMNIFFILWVVITIFMLLFFKYRRAENLVFLAAIGIYFLLITNIIGFILKLRISDKNKKIWINIMMILILGTHFLFSYKKVSPENDELLALGFGGQNNERAIQQIRYLVDFYLEDKKVIYLASYEKYLSKAEDYTDYALISLGYGKFAEVFLRDIEIEFVLVADNIDERVNNLKESEAILFYDNECNFFLK